MSGIRWLALLAVVAVAGLAPGVASAQDSVRRGDVLFVFDTTGSMGGAISGAKAEIRDVMGRVRETIPDVQFGVADMRDYPQAPYGQTDDYPWKLRQGITSDPGAVQAAVDSLTTGGGADGPESYETALQSAMGGGVGWRSGAEHMVVLIGDNVPHDDALNADPVPSDEWTQPSPFRTWDATAGALGPDWQGVLSQMRENRFPLLFVYYYGSSAYIPYWRWWAGATNGSYTEPGSAPISDAIVEIIHRQATAPCPAGESRDSYGVCTPGGGGGGETPTGGGDVLPYNCVAIAGGVRCGPPSCTVAAPSKAKPKPRRRSRRRSSRRRRARSSEVTARVAQRPIPKRGEKRAAHLHTDPKKDPAPYGGLTDELKKQLGTGCSVMGAVGDSFTAWHHLRDDGELDCKDPDGYFRGVWSQSRTLKYWTEAPGVNAAYSGFGTNNVLAGGTDYCGNPNAPKAPIEIMEELIGASKQGGGTSTGQGDVVFISLPINNEDWVIPLAKRLLPNRIKLRVVWRKGPRIVAEAPSPEKCEDIFTKGWKLTEDKVKDDTQKIISRILRADVPGEKNEKEAIKKSKAKIYFVGYPNPAGTGHVDMGKYKFLGEEYHLRVGPLMPESCQKAVQTRLDEMMQWNKNAAKAVDGDKTPHVDFVTNEELNGKDEMFQRVTTEDAVQKRIDEAKDRFGKAVDKAVAKMLEELSEAIGAAEQALEKARKALEEQNSQVRRAAVKAAEALLEKAKEKLDKYLADKGLTSDIDIEDWKKARFGWPHQSAKGNAEITKKVFAAVKKGAGL